VGNNNQRLLRVLYATSNRETELLSVRPSFRNLVLAAIQIAEF